jgi:hypothetical protein
MLGMCPALARTGGRQRRAFGGIAAAGAEAAAAVRPSAVLIVAGPVAMVDAVFLVLPILSDSELRTVSKNEMNVKYNHSE